MTIKDVVNYLDTVAPPAYQEGYDNAGLIVGDRGEKVTGVLVCLDSIEAVVDEAIEKGCNLIVAHHPIVFSGLKKITGKNYVERVILKAIKNDIAIYAIHTNLDNVMHGVNAKIGEKLGLKNLKILSPKSGMLRKLVVYVPESHEEEVRSALFSAGAGSIGNYDECSFNLKGQGSFKGNEDSNAFVGEKGKRHYEQEVRIEVVYAKDKEGRIVSSMLNAHPYEEVAYDLFQMENKHLQLGAGMIGELEIPMEDEDFLKELKKRMKTDCVRYTKPLGKKVKKVAFCGGSGSFLLRSAIAKKADVFVTGDFKYHEFFDAEDKIMIADIGHFESEQFTIELLADVLKEKFTTFAVHLTDVNTNPINYL